MSQSGDVQVPVVPPPPALRVPDGPESSARRVVVKASDVKAEVGRNTGGSGSSRKHVKLSSISYLRELHETDISSFNDYPIPLFVAVLTQLCCEKNLC